MFPKKCPFCGSNATKLKVSITGSGKGYDAYIKCLHCQATGPRFNSTDNVAIKRWNDRKEAK